MRTKNWQKIVILVISIIIWYQDDSETHKGSPTKIFGAVRRKIFVRKSWCTPFMLNFCRYPKISETMKGSPTHQFRTVKEKNQQNGYTPLNQKKTKKLLKHRRFPLWTFLVLWDKNISTENHGAPNIHKIFDIRAVLKHIRIPLPTFGTARQNSFNIKSCYTPVLLIFFRYPELVKH